MKRYIGVFALGAMLAGLLTGCTPEPGACQEECANKEVTETQCDEGATDLISANGIVAEGLEGSLAIRKADPELCEDLYWARFAPTEKSTSAFEVILKINGTVVSVPGQQSDPVHPTLFAWTKAYQATSGETLAACVIPNGQDEICVEKTLP